MRTIRSADMYCRHPSFLLFILITLVLIAVPHMKSLEDSIQVLLPMWQRHLFPFLQCLWCSYIWKLLWSCSNVMWSNLSIHQYYTGGIKTLRLALTCVPWTRLSGDSQCHEPGPTGHLRHVNICWLPPSPWAPAPDSQSAISYKAGELWWDKEAEWMLTKSTHQT